MASYGVYNIKNQYKDDTFNGVQYTLKKKEDSTPIDLTGASIRTQFRKGTETGEIIKEISDGDGITVTDAENGIFKFDAFVINWAKGTYVYDVEITFPSGLVRTYVKGSLNVIQDITYG